MKEVILYKRLERENVQCQTCAHCCFILPGKRGICGVRENIDGKLFALNYGKAVAMNIDPIEKKPLFHFLPGTSTLSVAAAGCNFSCLNCQNYDISQGSKALPEIAGKEISPKEIVKTALKNNLPSISYTYTEPTVFLEYAMETMKLAREAKLKNVWVSNGFMSEESAKFITPYLDAINIDIKGFSEEFYRNNCGAHLEPVLRTAKLMRKAGVWLEITTLIIPTKSDSPDMLKKLAKFIKKELGEDTPWHVSQFSGVISWKLQKLPNTPVKKLQMAYNIGKEAGLKYVYIGNVPGLDSESTYCPKCNELCIKRVGYDTKDCAKKGACPKCGEKLSIVY
ncbi:MAG: AmmeMemoRadiSam system radical SAM enzyme [Candidatus Paceibacterota bacterium]|jgi:pyruvate formate lyase activating enzyme